MPSKKKKYNSRFPPARIKKIMQSDEEVGKVAQVVPIIISKALEIFVASLLRSSSDVTRSRNARTLTPNHIKASILSDEQFQFLRELAQTIPDVNPTTDGEEEDGSAVSTPTATTAAFASGQSWPTTQVAAVRHRTASMTTTTATTNTRSQVLATTAATVVRARGRPRKRPPIESQISMSSLRGQQQEEEETDEDEEDEEEDTEPDEDETTN